MFYRRHFGNIRSLVLSLVLAISLVLPVFALTGSLADAQNTPAPTNGYDPTGQKGLVQCGNKVSDPCTVEDVFNIFVIATNLMIGAVGLIAILAVVYSGYSMIAAAGNTESITKAKKHLTNAIIGVILVFLAFILINFVLYGILGVTGDASVFQPLDYIGLGSKP